MTVIKCAICGEWCPTHTTYVIHTEIMHKPETVRTHAGRFLTRAERSAIVYRGEARIGSHHFIGGII